MQIKRTLPLTILPLLAGTALGSSCYDKGQQWKDVGTETVLDEAFRRVCDKTRLAGMYPRKEVVRTCENVAGHSFLVTIQHIDSMYSLDPWFLSSGTCFDLLKKVGVCLVFLCFCLPVFLCVCACVDTGGRCWCLPPHPLKLTKEKREILTAPLVVWIACLWTLMLLYLNGSTD